MKLGRFEIIRAASAPRGEVGTPGTEVSPAAGGTKLLTQEDYNSDLQGTMLYDEIDRMRFSDSQIRAALAVMKLPLLSADWHVEAATDDQADIDIAEWIEARLFDGTRRPWKWVLNHILLYLDFGVMPFELVWDVKQDALVNRPMVILEAIAPRMPRTITEWQLDAKGNLAAIKQTTSDISDVTIPGEKLLVFVNEQEGANYKGRSILRAARKDWVFKERAQRLNAIRLERRAAGMDVGTLGPGAGKADKDIAEQVLMTTRVHERAYVLETDDFKYRIEGVSGESVDPLPTIQYHDLMILRGVLAEFLAMGGTDAGSFAMHADKTSFFLMALKGIADQITGEINRVLIPQWVRFNWGERDKYPRLTHSRLDRRDAAALAEGLAKLIPVGAITPDEGIQRNLRELFDLPELPETTEARQINGQHLSKSERLVDFVSMVRGLERAENKIVQLYQSVQTRQIGRLVDEAMKAIRQSNPERLQRITVPFREEAATKIAEPLLDLFRQGQREVKKELAKMASGEPVKLVDPLDPADDEAVVAFLVSRARAIAAVLSERLRGSMLRNSLDMMRRGDTERSTLAGFLTVLSDRDIKREARLSTSEALNIGRESLALKNRDAVKAVEYSAIMDAGTCGPCGRLDGTNYTFGSAEMETVKPPFRDCDGRGNCRCVLIYTFESEAPTRG